MLFCKVMLSGILESELLKNLWGPSALSFFSCTSTHLNLGRLDAVAAWQGAVAPTNNALVMGGIEEKRELKQTKYLIGQLVRSQSYFSFIRKRTALQMIHARHKNRARCHSISRADRRAAAIQIL